MNYIEIILKYIVKKWYIVLVCAFIGAGTLYFEKSEVKPSVPQNGTVVFTRVVKFDPLPILQLNGKEQEITIMKSIGMWGNMAKFLKTLDEGFDCKKLNVGWSDLREINRIEWMSKHFWVNPIGPGTYELIIKFNDSDAKDAKYINENGQKLMDYYTEYIQKASAVVTKNAKLDIINDYSLIDVESTVTEAGLKKKYTIIGFALGGVAGIMILSILALKKNMVN